MKGLDGGGPFKTMAHGDTPDVPSEHRRRCILTRGNDPDPARFGGRRRIPGGSGHRKVVTATAPVQVKLSFDRTGCLPWGIRGGKDGGALCRDRAARREPEVRYRAVFIGARRSERVLDRGRADMAIRRRAIRRALRGREARVRVARRCDAGLRCGARPSGTVLSRRRLACVPALFDRCSASLSERSSRAGYS